MWYRTLRRVGWAGLAAFACLVLAMALLGWTQSLSSTSMILTERSSKYSFAEARLTQLRARQAAASRSLGDAIADLPELTTMAKDLSEVFAIAKKFNLQLTKGDYQLSVDASAGAATYSAAFPIKARFSLLKLFSADVLRRVPHVALDDLRVERSDAAAPDVEARLRLLFFYRLSTK